MSLNPALPSPTDDSHLVQPWQPKGKIITSPATIETKAKELQTLFQDTFGITAAVASSISTPGFYKVFVSSDKLTPTIQAELLSKGFQAAAEIAKNEVFMTPSAIQEAVRLQSNNPKN